MNLADILADSAAENGDRIAIKLDDTELAYKYLERGRLRGREPARREAVSSRATGSGSCSRTSRTSPSVYYGVAEARRASSCR